MKTIHPFPQVDLGRLNHTIEELVLCPKCEGLGYMEETRFYDNYPKYTGCGYCLSKGRLYRSQKITYKYFND